MPAPSTQTNAHKPTTPDGGPVANADRALNPADPPTSPPTNQGDETVWADADLQGRADPHADTHKAQKVRRMFAGIAHAYDLNNRVHSLWMDQRWRALATRWAMVKPGDSVLDIACGTGDLTLRLATTEARSVIGADFTQEMLDIAERKRIRRPEPVQRKTRFQLADAQDLPFDDASFDAVTIAFGIRNVQHPERAIAEFSRVLRPGGRLVILEFERPRNPVVRWFNAFYSGWLMPRTATLLSRDRTGAYRYLPKSVSTFIKPETLMGWMGSAGLEAPKRRPLSLGICACYRAIKPGAAIS